MKVEVLFEDNHCLAVNKPAGLLSQGDETGDPSLVSWATDVPQGPLSEARERLRRAGPPAGPADVGRRAPGPDQQGGQPPLRAVPRGPGREGLLGHRRGRARGRTRASGPTSWRRTGRTNRVRRPSGLRKAGGKEARVAYRVVRRGARISQARITSGDGAEPSVAGPARGPRAADRGGRQVRGEDPAGCRGRRRRSRCMRGLRSNIRRVRK